MDLPAGDDAGRRAEGILLFWGSYGSLDPSGPSTYLYKILLVFKAYLLIYLSLNYLQISSHHPTNVKVPDETVSTPILREPSEGTSCITSYQSSPPFQKTQKPSKPQIKIPSSNQNIKTLQKNLQNISWKNLKLTSNK